MERVKTLIKKLQEQSASGADAASMLSTIQMLQAELVSRSIQNQPSSHKKVAIVMPVTFEIPNAAIIEKPEFEEKEVQILQIDEKDIEEELAQIKKNAKTIQSLGHHQQAVLNFDPFEEVPTLAHQEPIARDEQVFTGKIQYPDNPELSESLNDRLKQVRTELSQTLAETPIKDLRKAIGVNDRFQFINELFRGDEAMYERSIKTIQGFTIYAEAEFWIRRELKVKIGWLDSDPVVKQFDELVRRRFL